MDKILCIILTLLSTGGLYGNEECQYSRKHNFEVDDGTIISFSTEIKERSGLVIDINYEERKNDRVKLSSKKSSLFVHDGTKYIKTNLSSLINEGWQDIDIFVGTSNITAICTSSQMIALNINIFPGIKSIDVSSRKIKICEESCNIVKSIEKHINHEETFEITVFINSKNPITFKMRNSVESGPESIFELIPNNCTYKWKQISRGITCDYVKEGWNKLSISANKTSVAINNNTIQVDSGIQIVNISGSFLVKCKKGTPVWKVSNDEIPIPVSLGQEIVFIITSNEVFSPVFNLNGIILTLSWKKGLHVGTSGKPLEPKSYYIGFDPTSEMLILYNKEKKDVLLDMKIDKSLEFISVRSIKGEYSLALHVEVPSQQPLVIIPIPVPAPVTERTSKISKTDSPRTASPPVITLSVFLSLVIIGVIVIAVLWINKKRKERQQFQKQISHDLGVRYTPVSITDTNDSSELDRSTNSDTPTEVMVHRTSTSSGSSNSIDTGDSTETFKSYDEREKIMSNFDKQLKKFGKNKSVIQIMEELENVIDTVFKAIENKRLYGENSADSLLREHGLPGTVRDNQGNSLLHYLIFPVQQDNQTHGVNADVIKKFLRDHKVFANALNYKGQTPLHVLVIEASKSYTKKEWESMAQLLLDVGCDPRVHDNNGQLPEDIALYRGCIYLQTLLKETQMDKGEITKKSKIGQWPSLLKGTKENDTESVRQLLLDNVPILPLSSSSDPLRVAIQRGNIELTMLLLSAGAPLCGRTLIGLNPLEVSHSIPKLNEFLPALIRREFYNCLRSESEMLICNNDSDLLQLNEAVIKLSDTIKEDGHKRANWSFSSESKDISERSKEARKMLKIAASKGMGLTCQMIGLEDVFLHPLPFEISPDSDAKPNSLVILCRDLELSLSLKEGNIPYHLKEEYEEYNFKKLGDFCEENDIALNSLYDKQTPVNKKVLKYIAEQGLDITYKKISRARNGQLVDLIVDPITGYTMLHSAAYNGRMGMVEYLLLNKASDRIKTDKGFTAAHVAAMRGHRECMEYILAFSKLSHSLTDDKTNSGLTAQKISDGYASEINNLSKFLLHENVSHSILSEPKPKKKSKLVLDEKKSIIQDCLSKESLDYIIPEGYINEHKNIWQQLKEESELFVQKLKDTDSRFNGKTINHHRNEDALELLLMDSYQIYLEIDNNEYWQEKNLHEAFIKSCYRALENYTVNSSSLCIVPPVFKPTMIGANIFVSYCSQQITTHISIHVIPIMKENLNLDTDDLQLSKMFNDTIAQTTITHIANTNSGKCTYVTVDLEKQLFAKVDSSKLLVLSICRFIKKILYPHWWFPRIESRRHGRQWHHYAVSLQSVPDRLLISCFLWEIFKVPEEKWDNSSVLDRVLGVYKQMVIQDKDGKVRALPHVISFLDPGKDELKVPQNIPVIIEFLQDFIT